MIELINDLGITNVQWVLAALCGLLIGMAKTGLSAIGLISVVILAALFGGKASAGIALPMLCVADIMAVLYYNKHADFKLIFKLLPWILIGIVAGLFTGNFISDQMFKITIGSIVLLCVFLMIALNRALKKTDLSGSWWLAVPAGFMGGVATMIGNAASPIIIVYFLAMKLPKNEFIGTGAWFFLIINLIKLPLHFFFWHTISTTTLLFNLMLTPAIFLGGIAGIFLVKKIPNKEYVIFIQASTLLSALVLIFKNL